MVWAVLKSCGLQLPVTAHIKNTEPPTARKAVYLGITIGPKRVLDDRLCESIDSARKMLMILRKTTRRWKTSLRKRHMFVKTFIHSVTDYILYLQPMSAELQRKANRLIKCAWSIHWECRLHRDTTSVAEGLLGFNTSMGFGGDISCMPCSSFGPTFYQTARVNRACKTGLIWPLMEPYEPSSELQRFAKSLTAYLPRTTSRFTWQPQQAAETAITVSDLLLPAWPWRRRTIWDSRLELRSWWRNGSSIVYLDLPCSVPTRKNSTNYLGILYCQQKKGKPYKN